jgi:hypothetical protein
VIIATSGSLVTALKKYSSNSAMTTRARKFMMISIIVKFVKKGGEIYELND